MPSEEGGHHVSYMEANGGCVNAMCWSVRREIKGMQGEDDGFSNHHIGPASPSSPNQDNFTHSNCPSELLKLI